MALTRFLRTRAAPLYRVGRGAFEAVAAVLPPWQLDGVPGPVSRADLMLEPSLVRRPPPNLVDQYLRQGRQATDLLVDGVREAGRDAADIGSILDLGCGHGRVLRHLPVAFPNARVTAVDTDRRAAAFCGRHLHATATAVPPDPAALPRGPFDLLWIGSVLTHLDRAAGAALLGAATARLTPAGVLAFSTLAPDQSTHFAHTAPLDHEAGDDAGFSYTAYPYTRGGDYGVTFHSAWFVDAEVPRCAGAPMRRVLHRPAGWHDQQDLWVWARA